MAQPGRRLASFVLGLLLLFVTLELVVRQNAALFEAASHRALAKVAMFERRSRVDFVFLGSSRTQDGCSPSLVSRALAATAPALGHLSGFNAGFTGSNLPALRSLAPRFARHTGLQLVVIELSDPQISLRGDPWIVEDTPSTTVDGRIASVLRNFQLVRYRTALTSDNLGRLPALLIFASSLDGWETTGADQIAAWLGRKESPAEGFDPALWNPEVFGTAAPPQALNSMDDHVARELTELAGLFRNHGVRVVFVVPPLSSDCNPASERLGLRPLFSEVARRGRCEVFNFAVLRSLPTSFFRDPSHLNRAGRAQFARALATRLASNWNLR